MPFFCMPVERRSRETVGTAPMMSDVVFIPWTTRTKVLLCFAAVTIASAQQSSRTSGAKTVKAISLALLLAIMISYQKEIDK